MGLTKLVKNRISSEWKDIFNHNVEQLERKQEENQTSHKATNKRIDNLVLASGGDSPNEVIDARTNNQGDIFDTLKARIDAGENLTSEELKDMNETLTNQREEITQLNGVIKELYSGERSNVNLYVHAGRGNDTTADGTEEKPFKTIQAAVDGIPFLAPSNFSVHVAPGVYLEDVMIIGIIAKSITIIATNNSATDAQAQETGVYVRSIGFDNCNSYCAVRGFTQTDPQNGPGYFVSFAGGNYGALENCRGTKNTKNIDSYVFAVWNNALGNMYNCYIDNQNTVINALYASNVRFGGTNRGKDNNVVAHSIGAIIYTNPTDVVKGKTQEAKEYGGQVFSS